MHQNCLIYALGEGAEVDLMSCTECCDVCMRDGERKRERQRVGGERDK